MLSGIDENFDTSVRQMAALLMNPVMDEAELKKLIGIVKSERADQLKTPAQLHRALLVYNRYGRQSSFLKRLPARKLDQLTVESLATSLRELHALPRQITYTGSLASDAVLQKLEPTGWLSEAPTAEAKYKPLRVQSVSRNRIYLLDFETAQSLIRIEFADGKYQPHKHVPIDLFRSYFGSGMSSVVFQQLREARSLAYSAWGYYFPAPI